MKIDISSYGICERFSTVAVLLLLVECSRSTASSLPATNSFPPLKSSQQVHLRETKTAKRTKSDDGNEIMVEGADKTSINVLAPSVPVVLCAIKQAPSAIRHRVTCKHLPLHEQPTRSHLCYWHLPL